jgi:threonine aldolase
MDSIDLRSDTVTWPTPAMREAMANAEVGDDVYGDDPTVNRLEVLAAERMGKEAALFVASGTMGNLTAVLTHCTSGDAMIAGRVAHAFVNEVGGAAALGGVHMQTVPVQPDGTLALDDIRAAVNDPANVHYPLTRLVEIENTQGALGGLPLPPDYVRSVRAVCDDYGLKLHVDGARIWNAAVALGCDVKELADPADSVMFCLSKGLCAPVGSMLCGSAEFIGRARRIRKRLGGGMRQAGVLAAAGIIAIEEMTGRLDEDHANACRLAEGLTGIDGIELNMDQVKTNMVFFRLADGLPFDGAALAGALREHRNVKINPPRGGNFRLVTHYWITPERVDTAVGAIREEMARLSAA